MTYRNSFKLENDNVRADGFYYFMEKYHENSIVRIMILFKNGYVFRQGYLSMDSAKVAITKYINSEQKSTEWGAYRIDGDTLKIQYLYSYGNEFKAVWDVEEIEGRIENNEVIKMTDLGDPSKVDIYKFLHYPIQSTGKNWLMKQK